MELTSTLIVVGCAIAIFIIGKIFLFPIKKILKLVLNTVIGGAIIYIINLVGANFGFHIGLNIITSLVVGILGIPGAILLIILQFIIG
ncbi:MAG: pro-sigmaK processing inhibitor BofA family protein [Clostridia bacterium]|nr:pro-sigmaK processing inhibitor BofA family protein [Clostridia bacterium]